MLVQFLAQLGTIIRFVAEPIFGTLYVADKVLRDRTIVRLASGHLDGDQVPLNI
jgi:hypothetical protein